MRKKYDLTQAGKIANSLARDRGYDGYGSIDDPILREWIWERASKHIHEIVTKDERETENGKSGKSRTKGNRF